MRQILGLTLMELVVVVAIIALLVAVAYPNYVRVKQDTRRADAKAAVISTQSIVERYLAENNKANIDSSDMALDQFADYDAASSSPVISNAGYYKISIVPSGSSYNINATAIANGTTNACSAVANAQAIDQCSDSNCWVISLVAGEKQSTDSEEVVADEATTTCW